MGFTIRARSTPKLVHNVFSGRRSVGAARASNTNTVAGISNQERTAPPVLSGSMDMIINAAAITNPKLRTFRERSSCTLLRDCCQKVTIIGAFMLSRHSSKNKWTLTHTESIKCRYPVTTDCTLSGNAKTLQLTCGRAFVQSGDGRTG